MLIVNYLQSVAACNPFGSVRPKTRCLDTFGLKVLNGLGGHSTNISVYSYSSHQYKRLTLLLGGFFKVKNRKSGHSMKIN